MKVYADMDSCSCSISMSKENNSWYRKTIEVTEEEFELYQKWEELENRLFERYDAATQVPRNENNSPVGL